MDKPEANWYDPSLQRIPLSEATLEFLRTLTPHFADLPPLTDAQETAFRWLAKKGAVQGIQRIVVLHGEETEVLHLVVRGNYAEAEAPHAPRFPADAAIGMETVQGRLTAVGEHWSQILAREMVEDPVKVRGAVLTILDCATVDPPKVLRAPPPDTRPTLADDDQPAAEADQREDTVTPANRPKKRATKQETLLKVYAAVIHKVEHPEASEGEIAEAVGIPRRTLGAHPLWQEWLPKIEAAAADDAIESVRSKVDQIDLKQITHKWDGANGVA